MISLKNKIEDKIIQNLKPSHLEVINESAMHHVPKGSESHFKLIIVSSSFEKQSLIKRHRLVHQILDNELKGIHALSLKTYTSQEWEEDKEKNFTSPLCLGGSKAS